jgi:hypothetical protein
LGLDVCVYTTVTMVHSMEVLLGLPPMNNNDARTPAIVPLFSGKGDQPPFNADGRNLRSGLLYEVSPPHAPDAKESGRMNFSHAAVATRLNAFLWRASKGDVP